MRNFIFLSFILISVSANAVVDPKLSSVVFYGKQAAALFDLIVEPTTVRNFSLWANGKKVGATQKGLRSRWECTIHGKEEAFPTTSAEASLALCTVGAEHIHTVISEDGRSFSFEGQTGAEFFELIPGEGRTVRDSFNAVTITQKSYAKGGVDVGFCQRNVPDDAIQPAIYGCSISWR